MLSPREKSAERLLLFFFVFTPLLSEMLQPYSVAQVSLLLTP